MAKVKVEEIVTAMTLPITEKLNLELVDVEFVKEGANWYLRIFIDKPGGIEVEDCQAVSEEISPLLDEKDPITQSYLLEISSPGLDRPLKKDRDFERYKGELVSVATFAPFEGKKSFVGQLEGLENGEVVVIIDDRELRIPKDKISSVKLEVKI